MLFVHGIGLALNIPRGLGRGGDGGDSVFFASQRKGRLILMDVDATESLSFPSSL